MSAKKKNAQRLRDLRAHGVPINGDYVLDEEWGAAEQGQYIDAKTQKRWLKELGPVNRSKVAA